MSIIKNYQFQFSTSINAHVCVLAFLVQYCPLHLVRFVSQSPPCKNRVYENFGFRAFSCEIPWPTSIPRRFLEEAPERRRKGSKRRVFPFLEGRRRSNEFWLWGGSIWQGRVGKRILCEPQNQQNYFPVINFLTRVNQYFSLKIFLFRTVKIRLDQFELGNPKGRGEKIGRAWASHIGDQRNFSSSPTLLLQYSANILRFWKTN